VINLDHWQVMPVAIACRMMTLATIPDDWKQRMIKVGIPVTLENYPKLIGDGRKPDELSEKDMLDMFEENKTPDGWSSASIYME
jgi:hypothetical protein